MSISSRLRFAAAGAALMWFFDPAEGPARRASAKERVRAARRVADRVGLDRLGLDRLGDQVTERLRGRRGQDDVAAGAAAAGDGPLPSGVAGDPATIDDLLAVARAGGVHATFDLDGGAVRCTSCGTASAPEDVERIWLHRFEGATDPDELLTVSALRCPRCAALGTLVTPYGPLADAVEADVVLRLPAPTSPDAAPFTSISPVG